MKSTNNKSKKSNILIISLIAICLLVAAACQIFCDANKRSYGVFLDTDSENTEQIHDYDTVVIDADNFSADDIRQLHSQGNKMIYSYLNVGSLESFRDYYPEFKDITIGDYENWPEEKWIDVTDEGWQDHIAKTAKSYANKGVDGLFLDNLDVYDYRLSLLLNLGNIINFNPNIPTDGLYIVTADFTPKDSSLMREKQLMIFAYTNDKEMVKIVANVIATERTISAN